MNIGDTVKSINPDGQIQDAGQVVAIFEANFFLQSMKWPDPDHIWGRLYPDWKNSPIVGEWFETPQRTATLEEWTTSAEQQGHSRQLAERTYKAQCPVTNFVAFPIEDLQVQKGGEFQDQSEDS